MEKDVIRIVKRNGYIEDFNPEKIREAVITSADRVMVSLTDEALDEVILIVRKLLKTQTTNPTIDQVHSCVEAALEQVNPLVAKSYREYRDYKKDIVHILDKLRQPVSDRYGNPCTYQVVAVYTETGKVGLVTPYGEYIGTYDRRDITLSEDVDNDFFGYELEINKMVSNKLISTVMKHEENLLRERVSK